MKSTTVLLTLLGVGMAVLMSRSAQAAIVVGSCMGTAKYTTIQDAVNAAPSGSVIKVCPGGYPEQGGDRQAAHAGGHHHRRNRGRIYPSTRGGIVENDYPYSAQVLVQNTTGVTITNLIVDGTNSAPCGINYLAGIDFHNASGTVSKMAVRNQSAALSCGGCGVAALVDYGQQAQNVTLQNNDFRNQSTVAIYGSGSGLTLNTQNNFIAGPEKGETVGIMYNYATGAIQGNSVVDEVFPQATFATPSLLDAMGIAVYCTTATVTNNMVSNTQLGIAVGCEFSNGPYASNTTISGNKIFNTRLQDGFTSSPPATGPRATRSWPRQRRGFISIRRSAAMTQVGIQSRETRSRKRVRASSPPGLLRTPFQRTASTPWTCPRRLEGHAVRSSSRRMARRSCIPDSRVPRSRFA